MQKKNYFRIIIIVVSLFLFQFIYFNFIATSNIGEIQKAKAKIDSLQTTINRLNTLLESSPRLSYVSAHKLPETIVFCHDTLKLDDQYFRESLEREFYSLLSKEGQIQLYLKRSSKYTQMIDRYLKQNNLPPDLKYMAIHESALLPKIRSRSNAVGLWQFMRATGRLYGLKINRYIDERRDPERATQAAMRFLKELYRYYEDWPLVMAAYNGGHGRVSRALRNQNGQSFFDLSLPDETERYYFKVVATKILLSDPAKYGFTLSENDFFTPTATVSVEYVIKKERKTLEEICLHYDLPQAEFKFLNPKVIGSYLPRGTYEFYIPQEKYNRLVLEKAQNTGAAIPDKSSQDYDAVRAKGN